MVGEFYSVLSILMVFTALFAYLNLRYIKLPPTIGIMLISLVCSIILVTTGTHFPAFRQQAVSKLLTLDFRHLLMNAMLSFLLFAGAIQIDVQALRKQLVAVITFATASTLLSTFLIGCAIYLVFPLFHTPIPFLYCLLFGALISPTDPIAVLSILKEAHIPKDLEIKITGESLFNDGVGVVIFLSILEIAEKGVSQFSVTQIGWLFLKEAGGGIVWGVILGYSAYLLLRKIDNYKVEVLITLAIVMGGYVFADWIDISGPLAMVVAGIITGNKVRTLAVSPITKDYIAKFWELIDEILNAILFLLMGFEMLVVVFNQRILWMGLISIVIVLLARLTSVSLPVWLLSFHKTFEKHAIPILTWGGLRGGLAVALALSLPDTMYREPFVSITYIVVIFSILVQGLTVGKVARKLSSHDALKTKEL
jgi:CPA1 family monovalent cation:H+ antiporter